MIPTKAGVPQPLYYLFLPPMIFFLFLSPITFIPFNPNASRSYLLTLPLMHLLTNTLVHPLTYLPTH